MVKPHGFDALVVFTERAVVSATTSSDSEKTPFSKTSKIESSNIIYGYFLQTCHEKGVKVAFASSADIIGPGLCSGYWLFKKNQWVKVKHSVYAKLIFAKVPAVSKEITARRKLLFSSKEIRSVNHQAVFKLFGDKQMTYDVLSSFTIPTITIKEKTSRSVAKALRELKTMVQQHPSAADFSDGVIMKDRFGACGEDIYKFKANQVTQMVATLKQSKTASFIIQPFVNFDTGYTYEGELFLVRISYLFINLFHTTYPRLDGLPRVQS